MSLPRAFFLSFAVAAFGVLAYNWVTGNGPTSLRALVDKATAATPASRPAAPANQSHSLREGVAVRNQITLASVAEARDQGFRTIIDLRPDGEAPDQPAARLVAEAAGKAGLRFAYVPTPHGDIPDATVDEFARAIAIAEKPVLLYCRSGSRAARVWALAEAASPTGADAATIEAAVRAAGQKVDDLKPRIASRIAHRGSVN